LTDWPAPLATAPLHAAVEVPGSKSLTNRLLVLAALADGPSTISGALRSRDTDLMIGALRRLGVQVDEGRAADGSPVPTTLVVTPPQRLRGGTTIDVGLAGTVMRFLPPVAALADGPVAFDGDAQARQRPMAALLRALEQLGVAVQPGDGLADPAPPLRFAQDDEEGKRSAQDDEEGKRSAQDDEEGDPGECRGAGNGPQPSSCGPERGAQDRSGKSRWPGPAYLGDADSATGLPFTVIGRGAVAGGEIDIDASASSQFVSALLLAAPRFTQGLTLRHVGEILPSLPHIEMTVAALRDAGVSVDDSTPGRWRVEPGPIRARDVRIEPDLSNALPFLAAALVAGGTVSVAGWPTATTQPGGSVPDLLTELGGHAELHDGTLTITGTGELQPVDLDLSQVGELAPNIAVLCALAPGTSRLRGIAHLRGHETNRLAALTSEINRIGGTARETADGLEIIGRPDALHGELFRTYHDHRMATSAALLGLRVPGIVVENVETTAKTLPHFSAMWDAMLSEAAS